MASTLTVPAPPRTIRYEGQDFLVDEPRKIIPSASPIRPATEPPVSFSLAQYQTPIRNQGDRGTCWAFAGAAALEAAYKRTHNISIVLSPQYVFFLGKVQELAYTTMDPARSHENNSTLWGFQGASDIIEKLTRSAVCPESYAPYISVQDPGSSQEQMAAVQATIPGAAIITQNGSSPSQAVMDAFEFDQRVMPSAAFAQCSYQVAAFESGNNWSPASLESIISSGHEVVTSINLQFTQDGNGVWQYDPTKNEGGHVFLLIGYDRTKQQFLVKNSWGGNSFLTVSYELVQKCASDMHYITEVVDPSRGMSKRAFWMGRWNMDYDGWRGDLLIRRHTDYRNASDGPTRLGSFLRGGITYDVNGQFSDNYQRCTLFIASNSDRVTPGLEVGQRFDLYCFSWDNNFCAGTTNSGAGTYGALLSRLPLPAESKNSFNVENWVGSYSMNYDGWKGSMVITSVSPVTGFFTSSDGKVNTISGQVNAHELKLDIHFPNNNQSYDLFYHTWEKGIFSGTTVSGGATYGVIGFAS